jgi:hypothetical protein
MHDAGQEAEGQHTRCLAECSRRQTDTFFLRSVQIHGRENARSSERHGASCGGGHPPGWSMWPTRGSRPKMLTWFTEGWQWLG